MFLGEYGYVIDKKGRVAIPPRLRQEFEAGIVLSRGFDKCIIVYPLHEWQKLAEKLTALPFTRSNNRRLNRGIFGNAFPMELDRQGRVGLPLPLREHAEIDNEVVIVGGHNYLEIWSRELWLPEKALVDEQLGQIAEMVEVRG